MYRQPSDVLCQLCPKGSYAPDFSSRNCIKCPHGHTTRGLGSRGPEQCHYRSRHSHTPSLPSSPSTFSPRRGFVSSSSNSRRGHGTASNVASRTGKKSRLGFMFYNRWMRSSSSSSSSPSSKSKRHEKRQRRHRRHKNHRKPGARKKATKEGQ